MSDTKNGKQRNIYFSHHHALQGISSAIAHIERFSVYRKSCKGFISTRVLARNKVLLRLRGFLHAFHLVEMTTRKMTFPGDSSGFSNPLNDSSGYFVAC